MAYAYPFALPRGGPLVIGGDNSHEDTDESVGAKDDKGGLSTGALIGIIVGAVVLAAAVVVVIIVVSKKKKVNK